MLAGAPDLALSTLGREAVVGLIKYGKGTMPPHKDVLTPEMIEALADHVETLKP
jgi:mono/diheme cytochrome c family protein